MISDPSSSPFAMTIESTRHLVLVSSVAWGHLRGLCVLAASTVKSRPEYSVTFFTSRMMFDKVESEISRNLEAGEESLRRNIHLIALTEDQVTIFDLAIFDQSFFEQFPKLVEGKPVWCAKKNIDIPSVGRAPDAVVVDLFSYDQMVYVRKTHPQAKVYCWSPCPTHGVIPLLGPFGSDTRGLHRRNVNERMEMHGETLIEAAYQVIHPGRGGKVVEAPGIPPMYDYEIAPQKLPFGDFRIVGMYHLAAADLYHEADGVIIPTIEAYDTPEALAHARDFLASTSRKLYVIGPLLSAVSGENAVRQQMSSSPKSQEIDAFMARTLAARGPKSLVYMAFGSAFWSAEPEKTWAFVNTMLEKNVPFILSHSSPFAKVPPEIQEKVEASGIGLLTPWAPQQRILNHPVTGWFVTHCGISSTLEAISGGVPLIAWPFGAEQSFNASHSVENLNIAYELFEVRSGEALKVLRKGKTYTGTVDAVRAEAAAVLDMAFGADGEKKRQNILKLKEAAENAWSKDGEGRRAFEDLLSSF